MPSWKKVIISGSDAALNSLNVTTNVTASSFTGSFTGSFLGTASYATQALSASYAPGTSQTLQQVTTNGNTTTNSITVAGITNDGNLFLSGSNRLVYNNSVSSSLLFGFFDGSNIYGPYYQIFGNNYSNVTQRGSAEYVFDTRNGGESGFNVAEFNGSTWLRKFRVSQAGIEVTGSTISTGGFTGSLQGTASYASQALSSSYALTSSFAVTASYVATASYTPNLQQVTTKGNTTTNAIIVSSSLGNSILTVDTGSILVSNLTDGPVFGKTHHVIYDAISITANSTTTIAQLPAPAVAGFTFDYIAYVSGTVLQAGRAGVVKGILRNTETGVVTKAFQLNETTTLDLEDQGFGTAGLQFTIVQDTNGTSNQLVAITNNNWPYFINYTLTIYYNPNFS